MFSSAKHPIIPNPFVPQKASQNSSNSNIQPYTTTSEPSTPLEGPEDPANRPSSVHIPPQNPNIDDTDFTTQPGTRPHNQEKEVDRGNTNAQPNPDEKMPARNTANAKDQNQQPDARAGAGSTADEQPIPADQQEIPAEISPEAAAQDAKLETDIIAQQDPAAVHPDHTNVNYDVKTGKGFAAEMEAHAMQAAIHAGLAPEGTNVDREALERGDHISSKNREEFNKAKARPDAAQMAVKQKEEDLKKQDEMVGKTKEEMLNESKAGGAQGDQDAQKVKAKEE